MPGVQAWKYLARPASSRAGPSSPGSLLQRPDLLQHRPGGLRVIRRGVAPDRAAHGKDPALVVLTGEVHGFLESLARVAPVAGDLLEIHFRPVVLQLVALPVLVDLFPGQGGNVGHVRHQHVLRDPVAHPLVAVVQRDAHPVLGQIRKSLVHGEGGKEKGIAELEVGGEPCRVQLGMLRHLLLQVDDQAPGAQGEVMGKDLLHLVGSRQHGQWAQLDRTVSNGGPAGERVHAALVVHEVLVQRRGVLLELRKPDPGLLPGQGNGFPAHNLLGRVHELRLVGKAVERLQPLNLEIDLVVVQVPLRAAVRDIGDAHHRVRIRGEPSPRVEDPGHVPAQREQLVPVLKLLEEEVSFVVQPAPKLLGVHQRIIGNPELLPGFRHICLPLEPAGLRAVHRENVFRRRVQLDVVGRREDVPALLAEDLRNPMRLGGHDLRRFLRQEVLDVDASVEGDVLSEILLQSGRLHALCRGLQGVEDVHAAGDEIRNDLPDRPAGMEHQLDPFPVHDIRQALQRLEDVAVHRVPPHEEPLLGAQVREGPEHVDLSSRTPPSSDGSPR